MSIRAPQVRTAITELLENTLTSIFVVTGRFKYGVFAGQPDAAKVALALQKQNSQAQTHWFDVEFHNFRDHESSPVGNIATKRITVTEINIPCWTKTATTVEESARDSMLERIADDGNSAAKALAWPNLIQQTDGGAATQIVGGLMMGPEGSGTPAWEVVEENWDLGLINHRIYGRIIQQVTS